jgi:hypothetical protein|tara:strand:+ start:178 stop:420 length:243 start_codon:yes stop_codon:yes gene_type:complete
MSGIDVDESHLVGIPDIRRKRPKEDGVHKSIIEAVNYLFLGSKVDQNLQDRAQIYPQGAICVVIRTGDDTVLGRCGVMRS